MTLTFCSDLWSSWTFIRERVNSDFLRPSKTLKIEFGMKWGLVNDGIKILGWFIICCVLKCIRKRAHFCEHLHKLSSILLIISHNDTTLSLKTQKRQEIWCWLCAFECSGSRWHVLFVCFWASPHRPNNHCSLVFVGTLCSKHQVTLPLQTS